ncbi:hypothetical protein Aperf_G00000006944 [Anoplocephala perfoliata]
MIQKPLTRLHSCVPEELEQYGGFTGCNAQPCCLNPGQKDGDARRYLTSFQDMEGLPMSLAVTHLGLSVFQNLTKINTFSWAKIRKLSFRRKRFLIKLHSMDYDVIEFLFDSRNDCKRFWKKCIEHHAFFRCPLQERSRQRRPKVVTKGSSFRYIGRTQKELIRFMRESNLRRPPFERPSTARRAHPTVLTGPNYAHARVGTMSMTLRSKSADHRRHQLLDSSQLHLHGGILGSSRNFLDQVGAGVSGENQLKRAHSSFVPNATNIGLSTGAVATSGYSTMGGSSSGGHLAEEGLDGDGASLEGDENANGGTGERSGNTDHQELMGPMVPPSGIVRTDFDGQPSPVATVPPAVLASSTSITNAVEFSSAAPPKPSRMTNSTSGRQNSEYGYWPHSACVCEDTHPKPVYEWSQAWTGAGTLRRQASLAERRPAELYGLEKTEEESAFPAKQMSTSAICTFRNQPSTPVQVLVRPTRGLLPSTTVNLTGITNTIATTAQVRIPYTHDSSTGEVQFAIGSERNLQPYTPYREEEMLQAEEKVEEPKMPPSMKLLGCQCKTTATQTAPVSDEDDDEIDCVEMEDADMAEATDTPVSYNPGKGNRKKVHQHSNQSSSGRIDSIFDGGTDSSATAAQIVGIDQWSSSGTESTTGVIIRSGVTAEWTNEQEEKTNPEPAAEHIPNCPRRVEKPDDMSAPATILPSDTLPARTPPTRAATHPFGLSYGFSRSIPAGVHLAGLSDPSESSLFPRAPEIPFAANWVRERQEIPMPSEQFNYPELPSFGFVPRQPVHSAHMLPPHTCNVPAGFYGEGVAPCLYMHPLRIQDMKMCQRSHRDRPNTAEPHHHHHHSGHHHHHRHRGHHKSEGEHGPMSQKGPPPLPGASDVCCHGQPRYSYAPYVEGSPSNKRSHRKRDGVSPKETPPYGLPKRGKQRYKDTKETPRAASSSKLMDTEGSRCVGDSEPPALPNRPHHSHRHLPPIGGPQPPTLPTKPGEAKEESQLCKLHSQAAVAATDIAGKRRQEEAKTAKGDDRKQITPVGGHHHHHHRHMRDQDELLEAPQRLKRRPVQSPALVGEDPQSLGISSPILGEERNRVAATRVSPILSAVASTATSKRIPASKEYIEKIGSHKASIEALKKELRSVETASSAVTTATSGPAMASRAIMGRTSAFSRGLMLEGSGQPHPPPSISPSDEAAARLADASGSASFGDLRSAILASAGNAMGESSNQRKSAPKTTKDNEVLLAAPQDATYLESESDSSPEQVSMDTVRRSIHESTSKQSTVLPPGMSSPGKAPRPPSLPRSSSFSSTNSSASSSVVSYSRSQSLFSHGAAISDESSISQQSSSSDLSSDAEQSSSSMSSPDRCSHRRHSHRHRHACSECLSRSQAHLHSYLSSGSHRSLTRHLQRHSAHYHDQNSEEKRSKSSHSSRDNRPDSMLLKTLINEEIALETITRQQKLLKRELAKQKQLAAELEEAKRRTQQLLEEKAQMEKKIEHPLKESESRKESDSPRKDEKKEEDKMEIREASPIADTSRHRERHHRSSSVGKRHRHHRRGHRHRRPSSDTDEERCSDNRRKRVSSRKQDEDSVSRSSRQKHSHSKSRHRHHHKATSSGEKDEPEKKFPKEKMEKEFSGGSKEQSKAAEVQKPLAERMSEEVKQIKETPREEANGKVGNVCKSKEGLPPAPPHSPPPDQHEVIGDISVLSQAPIQPKTPEVQKKSSVEETMSSSPEKDKGLSSASDESGLARDIIKEVLKHTYSRGVENLSSESLSTSQPSASASIITSLPSELPISELAKRTKPMESSFMNPIELTSTCLEPVPEGRVAETYPISRPYRPEISTFLGSSGKDHQGLGMEEEEEEEEESDLDVDEIDSDSTSASEGSEDIEPFPLPPAPMPEPIPPSKEYRQLSPSPPPSEEPRRCREFHEVVEEMEGAAVTETSLMEYTTPLKPISPVQLSQAVIAEHPKPMEYQQGDGKCEIEGGQEGVPIEEEDIDNQEVSAEAVVPVTATPYKKSRNRKRSAKQRQKANEAKPPPNESADT